VAQVLLFPAMKPDATEKAAAAAADGVAGLGIVSEMWCGAARESLQPASSFGLLACLPLLHHHTPTHPAHHPAQH
jgi:hypothetical protein